MRSFLSSTSTFRAFTLVELLIALALSLILLIGMTELFSRVSGVMNDTRATLNMTENLDVVERQLRTDLAGIPKTLPQKPARIADPTIDTVSDLDGYLEITEGLSSIVSHPYVDETGQPDKTVGDVDDIIGFTVIESAVPFRGLIDGVIAERNAAEIVWFVRGNTLYRRFRLIDDQASLIDPTVNSIDDLARRDRRFGHDGVPTANSNLLNSFPYPLYDDAVNPGWKFLRMPILEETLHNNWDSNNWRMQTINISEIAAPDLWNQPFFLPNLQDRKSGSLKTYVSEPRHHRAGEDIILTNVLSFDIKVWDPQSNDFVDLGEGDWADSESTTWKHRTDPDDVTLQKKLPRVWDSWSRYYGTETDSSNYGDSAVAALNNNKIIVMPPYRTPLSGIQITIRCFDPASRAVKQITVVHKF